MGLSIYEKLFGRQHKDDQPAKQEVPSRTVEEIQANANKLWVLFKETVEYYKSVACPCAFPRFAQYTSIDCVDTSSSFYMSETEGFIQNAKDCFDITEIAGGAEVYNANYTCKKCGSVFLYGWSDFSIHVSRSFMKPVEIRVQPVGAAPEYPIPFFVGCFGHKNPDRNDFKLLSYDGFKEYIQKLKSDG